MANMLINKCISIIRSHDKVHWQSVTKVWIACDVGPHFRSYENAAHFLCTLVSGPVHSFLGSLFPQPTQKRTSTNLNLWTFNPEQSKCFKPSALYGKVKMPRMEEVSVLYLAEQHGKGACDRLFGWSRIWISRFIQESPIYKMNDLIRCYSQGAQTMQEQDPAGPSILISAFDPGRHRPSKRSVLVVPSLKITRTYSLTATPDRYHHCGVRIMNNVFTDLMPAGSRVSPVHIDETVSDELVEWRRGYYDKPRSWEQEGAGPGDENDITRRFAAQKGSTPLADIAPKATLEERVASKHLQLRKNSSKKKRQLAQLKTRPAEDSDESNSLSPSSSSTSSSSEQDG